MPTAESVNLANLERKNLPHIAGDLNLLQPVSVLNGLFNFFPVTISNPTTYL